MTIFGESAGGLSVLSQVVSPGARGLFQRAIVESGAYALTEQPLRKAEQAGAAFAAKTGCAKATDAKTAACLRGLPVAAILASQTAAGYQPDLDGTVLTQSIGPALASGHFNRVPIINGTNHDEWRFFVALDTLTRLPPVTAANYVASISLDARPARRGSQRRSPPQYPVSSFPSAAEAMGAAGTDAVFACPALAVDLDASKYVPVHAYEFSDENAPERFLPPLGFPYGAAHASEIQYLFGIAAAIPGAADRRPAEAGRGDADVLDRVGAPGHAEPAGGAVLAGLPVGQPADDLAGGAAAPGRARGFAAAHHCAFWASLASGPVH